jgi:hypothetical protein
MRVVGLLYAVTYAGVHVTVLDDHTRSTVRLAPSTRDLLPLVDDLTDSLRDSAAVAENDVPRLEAFAEDWGRWLVPEDILEVPPDVLVIVPHGVLHTLPLHLVRTAAGDPLACASGVTYASSMTSYCRSVMLNRGRSPRSSPRTAAGGGVDVKREDDAYRALAADVLVRFDGEPTDCSRYTAKDALESQDVDVVCLVTHGYLDPHDHRSSGLLLDQDAFTRPRSLSLYGGSLMFNDLPLSDFPATVGHRRPSEVLSLRELETMASRAELTLLLACSTGTAQVLQTDEPASLAEGLMRAGSASVIAPMWEARLDLASAWIREFLQAWLARSLPKALAARHAFRSLRAGPVAQLGPLHMRGDWV